MKVRRVGASALTVFAGTSIISSGLVSAFLAGTHPAQFAYTTAAANTCGAHPATTISSVAINAALVQLDSVSAVRLAAATPTATATASATAGGSAAAPTPTANPTNSSASAAPSASPTTSKPATPTPTPSTKSPTPTPSPTASAPAVQLCVSVQAVTTSVQPGGTATFAIWVWPSGGAAKSITLTASAKVTAAITPRFSVCPSASGATCTVGTLAAGQADELLGAMTVPKTAKAGQHAALTATAKATGATAAAPASASALVSAAATGTAKPTGTSSGTPGSAGTPTGVGVTLPSSLLPLSPTGIASSAAALPFLPSPTTDPGGSFPTVAPGAIPSAGTGALPNAHGAPVTYASDSLPLSTRLLGGQVLGLAVLAAALVIAIARLSLREPRRQQGQDAAPETDAAS